MVGLCLERVVPRRNCCLIWYSSDESMVVVGETKVRPVDRGLTSASTVSSLRPRLPPRRFAICGAYGLPKREQYCVFWSANAGQSVVFSEQLWQPNETRRSLVLHDISQLLNTKLDKETLATCVSMIEAGANPEALAVKQLGPLQYRLLFLMPSLEGGHPRTSARERGPQCSVQRKRKIELTLRL